MFVEWLILVQRYNGILAMLIGYGVRGGVFERSRMYLQTNIISMISL